MTYIDIAVLLLSLFSLSSCESSANRCEAIKVPMCQNMEYNQTLMPNQFNHESQDEAAMEAHQFWALVEINCAVELRFFLCSLYTPICLPNYERPIKACRSVCRRARMGCEKYMKKFGFEWPEHMNCDLFPEYGSTKEVCMDPMDATQQANRHELQINTDIKPDKPFKTHKKVSVVAKKFVVKEKKLVAKENINCPKPFINVPGRQIQFGQVAVKQKCIQSCHSVYFDQLQVEFTSYWIMFWSGLCLFSSMCTMVTYIIDSSRFKYPERPIIYLSICYAFISLGHLCKFVVGHEEMVCDGNGAARYDTTGSLPCTVSFVLIYFFGMASCVWWVVISFTWFLAAGLKWGTEAIAKFSLYFHIVAWLVPFAQTCIVLGLSLVDADPLSGICFVGNLNTYNLRVFVVLPSICYLVIGITFLIAGFVSLFRIRKLIKQQARQPDSLTRRTQKLEKLMLRIGVFSILYTVPATCVIACQIYEQFYRSNWEHNAICQRQGGVDCDHKADSLSNRPEFSVFLLKYLMSLIIGVTSGFWVWTTKTLNTWKLFLLKLVCCCRSNDRMNIEKNKKRVKCFNGQSSKRNSIIYFQANDDLENNPQNNCYESSLSSAGGCNGAEVLVQSKGLIGGGSSLGRSSSIENPESVVSCQFNSTSNTIATSLPFYQGGQTRPIYPQSHQVGVSNNQMVNGEFVYAEYGVGRSFKGRNGEPDNQYSVTYSSGRNV